MGQLFSKSVETVEQELRNGGAVSHGLLLGSYACSAMLNDRAFCALLAKDDETLTMVAQGANTFDVYGESLAQGQKLPLDDPMPVAENIVNALNLAIKAISTDDEAEETALPEWRALASSARQTAEIVLVFTGNGHAVTEARDNGSTFFQTESLSQHISPRYTPVLMSAMLTVLFRQAFEEDSAGKGAALSKKLSRLKEDIETYSTDVSVNENGFALRHKGEKDILRLTEKGQTLMERLQAALTSRQQTPLRAQCYLVAETCRRWADMFCAPLYAAGVRKDLEATRREIVAKVISLDGARTSRAQKPEEKTPAPTPRPSC